MSLKRETRFSHRVQKDLRTIECWFFKTQLKALLGIPDIIGIKNGKFFALELKMNDGRVSKLQHYVLSKIRACGGYAKVVYPSTWDDVLAEIKEL